MRFLIDECLHTSLVGLAQERGHEANHVNWLGLSGETDWALMPRVIQGDFTFVTNNAADFRRLCSPKSLKQSRRRTAANHLIAAIAPSVSRAIAPKAVGLVWT